ncbi:hypothetical protein NPX13_g8955 [Xylaria arbuscula]|uniref:Uncharacterized protein n=1 Tax=Xylaria arbuscula TaxID=114810 RepID=A0A9W8N7Y1_9PEZI|nr:hypothetical protein NPX13_g8955 [Xylaria arbuscula]
MVTEFQKQDKKAKSDTSVETPGKGSPWDENQCCEYNVRLRFGDGVILDGPWEGKTKTGITKGREVQWGKSMGSKMGGYLLGWPLQDVFTIGIKTKVPKAHGLHEALRLLELALTAKQGLDKLDTRVLAELGGLALLAGLEHGGLTSLEKRP